MKDSERLERIEKELMDLKEELRKRTQIIAVPQPYPVPYNPWPYYPRPYYPWPNVPTITWTATGGDVITSAYMDLSGGCDTIEGQ